MKKFVYLLSICALLFIGCDEDTVIPDAPDALKISQIQGSVVTDAGVQTMDLLANPSNDVDAGSHFTVTFSKAVKRDWLENASLPKILRTENGTAVGNVSFSLTVLSATMIRLTPDGPLEEGATYMLVINPGYEAEDGATLDDNVAVDFGVFKLVSPDPLTVARINGTIWNGAGFEGIDLLTVSSSDVMISTEFIVTFSRPVKSEWLSNASLPRILITENGEATGAVGHSLTVLSSTEIILSPNDLLTHGTTYQVVINAGYQAMDGGVLSEPAIANFATLTPDPLSVSSIIASDGATTVSMDNQTEASDVPVGAAFTISFPNTVILTDANREKIALELLINGMVDSQISVDLSEDLVNRTLTIDPIMDLTAGATYQLVLREGLEHDLGGTLEVDYVSRFSTKQ